MSLLCSIVNKSNCRYILQHVFTCITRRYQSKLQFPETEDYKLSIDHNMCKIVPVFKKAEQYLNRTALIDQNGKFTYKVLVSSAYSISKRLSCTINSEQSETVAFLCPNDVTYVLTQWAIWMSKHIALPLSELHPQSVMEEYIEDSEAKIIVTVPKYDEIMRNIAEKTNRKLLIIEDHEYKQSEDNASISCRINESYECVKKLFKIFPSSEFYANANAMILYTSGTTSKPKGVVISHRNLQAQVFSMLSAWKWSHHDSILHSLPLHHVHGIVNALMCPLYVGARCYMIPKFDVDTVWSILLGINKKPEERVNIYMAVPTIYDKLINKYDRLFRQDPKMVEYIKNSLSTKMRLMVSGSAPLPEPLFERWYEISGHKLLERYGMTETGMSLSNLYNPNSREPGYVGLPLPGVSVKIARDIFSFDYETVVQVDGPKLDSCDTEPEVIIFDEEDDLSGELLVKGDSVFKEYYKMPEATEKEFTHDRWFKTGDSVSFDQNKCLFKILGRTSIDIIKTGGYKVSALQVETVLLAHPSIAEVAVVSLPDETWGERIAAIVVSAKDAKLELNNLRNWAKSKLAPYSIPTVLYIVKEIPRNAMGKVNKKDLVKTIIEQKEPMKV